MHKHLITSLAVAAAAMALTASPAAAKGCNGYVNQMQWGCAPWDNNNGPQFPHYSGPAAPARAAPLPITRPGAPVIGNGNGNGLIASGGGNVITQDGASLHGNAGGAMRH